MARHNLRRAVLAIPLNLFFFSLIISLQGFASCPDAAAPPAAMGNSPRTPKPSQKGKYGPTGPVVNSPQSPSRQHDPEMEEISKAEVQGRLADAQKLLTVAIQKAEATPGSEKRLSLLLHYLADLEFGQGWYDDAVASAERALAIDKVIYGPESPVIARDLNNLAPLRMASRKTNVDPEAEEEYKQALAIARQNQGSRPDVLLMVLNNLAQYDLRQKRAADAQLLIDEALQVCQNGQGPRALQCDSFRNLLAQSYRQQGHANTAEGMSFDAVAADASSNRPWPEKLLNLETLARQYDQDGSYDLAETTYRQALALAEANATPDEPGEEPEVMNSLGEVLVKEGQNAAAEDLFRRSIDLAEQAAHIKPPQSPFWLNFNYLVDLYRREGRLFEIEPIMLQGIAIQEQVSASGSEPLADTLLTLARVYEEEGKYADAEPLCQRALKIQEAAYGPESPRLIPVIEAYSEVLRKVGETLEADLLTTRASKLRQEYVTQKPR
jgi:tetratricopeptide (TPR) repeat protein